MRLLSHALAGGSRDRAGQIHRRLRWLGMLGSTRGLAGHLRSLARLNAPFARLQDLYPRLAPACLALVEAQSLLASLQELRENPTILASMPPEQVQRFQAALAACFEDLAPPAFGLHWSDDLELSADQALMLAAAQVLVRTWNGHAKDTRLIDRVLATFGQPQNLDGLLAPVNADAAAHSFFTPAGICESLVERLFSVPAAAARATAAGWPDTRKEYDAFLDWLRCTDAKDLYHPVWHDPSKKSEPEAEPTPALEEADEGSVSLREWGNRGSQLLLDRELLQDSNHGLTAGGASALAASFQSAPRLAPNRITRREELLTSMGGLLAQMAALTASSLHQAAQLPVWVLNDAALPWTNLDTATGRQLIVQRSAGRRSGQVIWLPYQREDARLALPIEGLDLGLADHQRDLILDELSPVPVADLRDAMLDVLGKRIERSRHQVDLSIKHAVARAVFSSTANRGLVAHLCTTLRPGKSPEQETVEVPERAEDGAGDEDEDESEAGAVGEGSSEVDASPTKPNVRRESLSNYIHVRSAAVRDAYRRAVQAIRFPEVPDPHAGRKPSVVGDGEPVVNPQHLQQALACLARRALKRSGKTLIQHHNDFVMYVGVLFVLAVGHRRSRFLLPFLHDLDLDGALAFIADKIRAGSESRFVPLADALLDQMRWYLAHVQCLIFQLNRSDPALARSLELALGQEQPRADEAPARHAGLLFRIRAGRAVPLTTQAVDWALAKAMQEAGLGEARRIETRGLRRHLATWLADDGISGSLIEVLLGHVREEHPFGAASVWIPQETLDRLRNSLGCYLEAMGAASIGAPWARACLGRFKAPLPTFELSTLAYEGRKIEADEARRRARVVALEVVPESVLLDGLAVDLNEADLERIREGIRSRFSDDLEAQEATIKKLDEMARSWRRDATYAVPRAELFKPGTPAEWVTEDGPPPDPAFDAIRRVAIRVLKKSQVRGPQVLLLDDDTVAKLSNQIELQLANDAAARAKIKEVFAELASRWRRTGQYRVTAAALNLTRFSAGPVPVAFGRHRALAQAVIDRLDDRIEAFLNPRPVPGQPAKAPTLAERLGVLTVLLVCCDAVLNRLELQRLVETVQAGDFARFEGQLQLRASIVARESEYDRTVDLTSKSAAAICGYLRQDRSGAPSPVEQVEAAANQFLGPMLKSRLPLDLGRLLTVMRAYWFLRLPGSVYASVIGDNECNAPSRESMALLLGAQPPVWREAPPTPRAARKVQAKELEAALTELRHLVNDAEGKIEDFKGSSRERRQQLRRTFSGRYRPGLMHWMQRQLIVDLAANFVYYMLEVGGFKVETYSFRSLQTYRQRVLQHIVAVAWDRDLLALDAVGLEQFFRAVIERIQPAERQAAMAPLRLFMRFLHEWNGAPNTRYDATTEPRLRRARCVVVPVRWADQALEVAKQPDGKASATGSNAASMLAVNRAFGLRPTEGYGLKLMEFRDRQPTGVRLRHTVIRSLKTFARTVPISLAGPVGKPLIEARVKLAKRQGSEARSALFFDETRGQLFDNIQMHAIGNWAMKKSTGDGDAVQYSLRHTFATSLMSQLLLPDVRCSPIAAQIAGSLALPAEALTSLAQLHPGADLWPHQLDRLGMWLGQAGVTTLARTYWHGAWWVSGEYCEREARRIPWRSATMGALLGVTDAAFRLRLPKRMDGARATDGNRTAAAMQAIVRALTVKNLVERMAVDRPDDVAPEPAAERPAVLVLDALLMARRNSDEDLTSLGESAAGRLAVPRTEAEAFFKAYEDVGSSTAMFDFEPDDLRPQPYTAMDVYAGADLRDGLLASAVQQMLGDKAWARSMKAFLQDWQAEVDGAAPNPRMVSRRLDQLRQHLHALKQMGYAAHELVLHVYAATPDDIDTCRALVQQVVVSDTKLSRASRIGVRVEFGLEVAAGRGLPIGRDWHRVMLGLAVAGRAGLFGWD
jgi:site-specific recombinase XerD